MQRYGKLINGVLTLSPNVIYTGDRQIINPPVEMLVEYGYKPMVFVDPVRQEGYFPATDRWVESETEITQVWEYVEAANP